MNPEEQRLNREKRGDSAEVKSGGLPGGGTDETDVTEMERWRGSNPPIQTTQMFKLELTEAR